MTRPPVSNSAGRDSKSASRRGTFSSSLNTGMTKTSVHWSGSGEAMPLLASEPFDTASAAAADDAMLPLAEIVTSPIAKGRPEAVFG